LKKSIALAAGILAVVSSADAQAARPKPRTAAPAPRSKPAPEAPKAPPVYYEFKGARLGMTIDEWKAVPIPATYESSYFKGGPTKVWCSTDTGADGKPVSGFYMSSRWREAGVVQCKYARMEMIGSYGMLSSSSVKIGDRITKDVTYNFLDGKLFLIDIDAASALLDDVMDGLTAKWGKQTSEINDTTQNKAGAAFPHTVKVWMNPAATIRVEAPYSRIDDMNVTYSDVAAMARLRAAEEKANPAADKM
jgi:hypothetical protein